MPTFRPVLLLLQVRAQAGLTMVDSVDLVVLGAAFGNGKNAALLSSYLMGCWDEDEDEWQLVCKVSNGLTDKRLSELTKLCTSGDSSLMVRLSRSLPLPLALALSLTTPPSHPLPLPFLHHLLHTTSPLPLPTGPPRRVGRPT